MYITIDQDIEVEVDLELIQDFIQQADRYELREISKCLAEETTVTIPVETLHTKFTFGGLDSFLQEFQDFAKEQGYYFNFPTTGL